jgi:hypothetical protein
MNGRPIGYYVHHHGAGHAKRARAIAGASVAKVVLIGTGIGTEGVDLVDDRMAGGAFDGRDAARCRPEALHYAPLDHEGVRSRVAAIARWIATERPALMVVDVSVEVAMLARLASVPVVYVRLNGDRSDPAHLESFRNAVGLLAPFHEQLDSATMPRWVREKTRYLPGIASAPFSGLPIARDRVLVVIGRGGPPGDGDVMAQAARCSRHLHWCVIGPCTHPRDPPDNLEIRGWVTDPDAEIAQASVVIGAAGDGFLTSILAADRPFICIPEARPYDEQRATADRLGELGAAVVLTQWPEPERWPALIAQALDLDSGARQSLHDPDGIRAAADWIAAMAGPAGAILERAA